MAINHQEGKEMNGFNEIKTWVEKVKEFSEHDLKQFAKNNLILAEDAEWTLQKLLRLGIIFQPFHGTYKYLEDIK